MTGRKLLILVGVTGAGMLWLDRPVMLLAGALPVWLTICGATCPLWLVPAAGLWPAAVIAREIAKGARRGSGVILLALSALTALAVAGLLKHMIGRARPEASAGPWSFAPLAFDDRFASFPSAQASVAAAVALSLAIWLPRLKGLFVLFGAAACLARVLAGAHWFSDVIAGWVLGAAAVGCMSRLIRHLPRKADAAR